MNLTTAEIYWQVTLESHHFAERRQRNTFFSMSMKTSKTKQNQERHVTLLP